MNYPVLSTSNAQPAPASIILPPISTIDDFRGRSAHRSPHEIIQPLPPPPPPPPPRQLPPLPYYHNDRAIPQQPDYTAHRSIYPELQMPAPYQLVSSRVPLPSTSDPSLMVAPTRHKTKEVKRRTKTGCLTCRKRRIKVSLCSLSPSCFQFYNAFDVMCEEMCPKLGGKFTRFSTPPDRQRLQSTFRCHTLPDFRFRFTTTNLAFAVCFQHTILLLSILDAALSSHLLKFVAYSPVQAELGKCNGAILLLASISISPFEDLTRFKLTRRSAVR